jgi:hypothetical protein
MSDREVNAVRCTPTDPSLEFDLFEVVRLRLAEALTRRDYDQLEAERIALYVVKGVRPVSQFLKVLTGDKAPGDDEIMDALTRTLDEAPALVRATRLLLRAGDDEG